MNNKVAQVIIDDIASGCTIANFWSISLFLQRCGQAHPRSDGRVLSEVVLQALNIPQQWNC